MIYELFKSEIIGYKNKIKGKKSQDYSDYKVYDNYIVAAVADGHSTNFFEYSKEGAKFACKASIDVLNVYANKCKNDIHKIKYFFENGEIQQKICDNWLNLVKTHYNKVKPVVFKVEYRKYGTTLAATLITKSFRAYLRLGDSSIVEKQGEEFKTIFKSKKDSFYVDSMSDSLAYKKMKLYTEEDIKPNDSEWIILFTDGFENSFDSSRYMFKSLSKTIQMYSKSVFSRKNLLDNYEGYLTELSENSTYDDISILFVKII